MKFSENNSIKQIMDVMKDEKMNRLFCLNFPEDFLNMVPEELRDVPVKEVVRQVSMPWGAPFLGKELIRAANIAQEITAEKTWKFIPLWSQDEEGYIPDIRHNDKSSVFLMVPDHIRNEKRPAVIICPGGGYELISFDGEGIRMAEKLEEKGYAPFLLGYRVKPNLYPEPQKDLALAIKYVRANAEQYGIDADSLMLMGSSAGGHLCASTVENAGEIEQALMDDLNRTNQKLAETYKGISIMPQQMCLNYPVISFVKEAHEPSFQALTAGDESLREKLSCEKHVTENFPRTFIWVCEDDGLVPASNAKRMAEALVEKDRACKLCTYPQGDHGCGLAEGTSAAGWLDEMLVFMNESKQ